MDGDWNHDAVICKFCGDPYTIPEDEVDGNLPRVLLCGHIFCTSCLLPIESGNVISCPECEVESTLPEGGVYGLQEDSRIIGLIYTTKMNKLKSLRYDRAKNRKRSNLSPSMAMNGNTENVEQPDVQEIEKSVDEALVQAAKNHAQLEHIRETLTEQVNKERARLEMEIKQTADKAVHAVQKWKDVQLCQLSKLEMQFCSSQKQLQYVQERIKALDIAMQMAREVRRVPFLEQYCILDKVLETLRAPVDNQSFGTKSITLGSGMRCVLQSQCLNQGLTLSLKIEISNAKQFYETHCKGYWAHNRKWQFPESRKSRSPSPQSHDQRSTGTKSPPPQGSSGSRPHRSFSHSCQSSDSEFVTPDVIIEEVINEEQQQSLPPADPEVAHEKWRSHKKRPLSPGYRRNVPQWVVVTHVVNPSHFYIRYVAEKRETEILSKRINRYCSKDNSYFSSTDTVKTGSVIFVKSKRKLWCRASVIEVVQSGCTETVESCLVTQLGSVRVFFIDHGQTTAITVQSENRTSESLLKAVNNHMRRVHESVKDELDCFAPQAVRCSLKDLVPYELTKGWTKEAQVEFYSLVGSAAVEMRPLGQDTDSLLVDLKKAPMDQSRDLAVSVREYLVFIEVARFYAPVTQARRVLLYYPPVYPKIHTELNAVVSHILNPSDFYIQLVDNMESLLLSAKLQKFYNAIPKAGEDNQIYCPVIGQACVARFDDKWYRAQIIGLPGGRRVEVLYVDFGNTKILSVCDLRKIKDEFFALPSMAIHCCLSDLVPLDAETWSDACITRFMSLADQKLVTIEATRKVPKSEPLPVKLFESDLNGHLDNIAEMLVKEELAAFKEGFESEDTRPTCNDSAVWDPPLECTLAKENTTPTDEEQEFHPQLELPGQLKEVNVRVSHVNSPSSFYIQFTKFNSQLKRICELVKQECEHMEPQDVVWKADMYCAALINGVWERGQICADVTSSSTVEVIRCDHGNKVKMNTSNLRPLPTSLIGSLALECTLPDIRPAGGRSTWTATACDFISYHLTGASAVVTIKELTEERPVPVTLFCSNRMGQLVSIADFLASEGLALRERKPREVEKSNETGSPVTDPQTDDSEGKKKASPETATVPSPSLSLPASNPTCTIPKPASRTIMSAEKVKTPSYRPPELPYLGHVKMTVSAIGEDGLIYTRTHNAECQLESLRERIQQCIKTLPRQKPYTWKSVQGCAVIGPDMLWYRGQVLEVLGGTIKVQYVDYGLVENIPVVHLYPMLLCDDVPQLCVSCQLYGINPIGGFWQHDAVALLKEMLLNRCVDMQIRELPTNPRAPLTVDLFLDGLSISKILCHHEHGTMDRMLSPQKEYSLIYEAAFLDDWDINTEGLKGPEETVLGPFIYPDLPQGEKFPVRVKHLWTPNQLFLWPLEGMTDVEVNGETLEEALTRISIDVDDLPRLTNFPEGSPCLAEYSDGKYYRAKMIKILSLEPVKILVQHVDFGSDDTVPTTKLRQMPPYLLQFPCQAIKVKVGGFKAPIVNAGEDMLPYSPKWSVRATMDMIDLLHGNITASVLSWSPELTVLLYNEEGRLVHLPLVTNGLAEFD
ncbi:RING finger protein 17 [Sphaeramia orbicularis]|uniref:RING finger protein 17 n=1 Tax=Sphaeramia orbicularis TaxID=375764 RepID=UPI00117EC5EC|nr:RING finger protein 17 [Sphaeramia orbicularis]